MPDEYSAGAIRNCKDKKRGSVGAPLRFLDLTAD